ncbi:MAG: DUF2510 domain-containing protein [Pseudolysinimonas sp.]
MTAPAAGWYHDPADSGAYWRWWDGATWTDHIRAKDEGAQTAPNVVVEPVPAHAPVFTIVQPAPELAPEPVVVAAPPQLVPEPASGPVVVAAPPQLVPEPASGPVVVPAPPQPAPPQSAPPQPAPAPSPAPAASPVPTPAPGPQPVTTSSIPQPGQVAASPTVAGGAVNSTPETPVSDQTYWHSSAAEVIQVPRLSQASTGAIRTQRTNVPSYVRDWQDLGSPNTGGVWLLAFSPILAPAIFFGVGTAMRTAGLTGLIPFIAAVVAALLATWIFAALDARALANRGYHAPRVAWMLLLPPLAYLIARGKAVRRETKAAWPPELVFVLIIVGGVAAFVVMSAVIVALYAPLLSA